MFQQGRLGWRLSRPNDFAGPDKKPLRDTFGEMQKFMTWPHFGFDIDDGQAYGTGLGLRDITALEDPYQLIRANSTINVPRDFDRWLFIGHVAIQHSTNAGRHMVNWQVDLASVDAFFGEVHTDATGGISTRIQSTIVIPVSKSSILNVASLGPAAGTVLTGQGWGFFLPMA